MKKSYSVNISGIIFQVDEDAYDKLNRYLDRLDLHFADTQGKEEIIADIEQRIAEMVMNKLGDQNRVVTLVIIEDIIRTLGEPADFDDNIQEPPQSSGRYRKRLYRDPDDKVLGGVASGMGAYFNTDPIWFRIGFIALTIFGGSGILIYLVLWLIVPEARTTAERLEMRGEPININNIERTIKEEMNDLRSRFGNWKQGKGYRKKKDPTGRVIESAGQIFVTLTVLFAKILAGVIGFSIIVSLIALFFALFVPGISFHGFPFIYDVSVHDFLTALTGSSGVAWIVLLSLVLIILLPLLGLLWTGIRLLFGRPRAGKLPGVAFSGLWIVAILFITVITIININDFSTKGFVTKTETISVKPNDTLIIGMTGLNTVLWIDDDEESGNFRTLKIKHDGGSHIVLGKSVIEFRQSNDDSVVITSIRRARGDGHSTAKERAEEIIHTISVKDNRIDIEKYFSTTPGSLFRNQEVKINIYIPENHVFIFDPVLQQSNDQIKNLTPLWDKDILDKPLTMKNNKLVEVEKPVNSDEKL